VAGFARALPGARQLVLGGKSMGGRMCSMAAAQGLAADGLLFLGYPLHAPGKPEALRDAHLYGLQAPLLFVQGTRDAFARWDLLTPVLERLASRATLHAIDEGDHSFKAPKRAGLSPAQIEAGLVAAAVRWLDAHGL
jgi:predicted alpha/beta-hydrolase family hydrolase